MNRRSRYFLFAFLIVCLMNGFTAAQIPELNLNRVPFSVRGSYFAVSTIRNKIPRDTLFIKHFIGYDTRWVFGIIPFDENNTPAKYTLNAVPWVTSLKTNNSEVNICFENPKTIRIKGTGGGFELTSDMVKYPIPMPDKNQYRIIGKNRYDRFMVTCTEGKMEIRKEGPVYKIIVLPDKESCGLAIEEYVSEWVPRKYKKSFEECASDVKNEFETFLKKSPRVSGKFKEARNLALYINWSSIVYPRGLMSRPGMLMTKNWMNYIWSWDNCFNAIGMAGGYPDLAWDQIMVVLKNQDELGILPDRFRDVFIHYGFTKPPVYGFAIGQLEKIKGVMNKERYEEVYPYLVKLTNFWLKYRDDNQDMLPEYHNGNDSGWDNATVFDIGFPVEGPDLSSFLVIQMDKLSDIAGRLGLKEESVSWKLEADTLFKRLMSAFWKDGKFVYKNSVTGKYVEHSESLLPYIPIILGKRFPEDVQKKMIHDLKTGGIITKYGPATENPSSPKYGYDSYWRGPVWAPSTYIIVEGLNECGEHKFAKEIAEKYCNLCLKSGFSENFDAVTGKAFRDPAYTWTASVFLYFLNNYID